MGRGLFLGLGIVAVAALVIAGVLLRPRSGPPPAPTLTPQPTPFTPEAVLARSGEVMAALESFHFRLSHRSGSTPLLLNLAITEAEGDVVKPDRLSLDLSGAFGNLAVRASLIAIGDTTYMTNPITGGWETAAAGVSPLGFFDPGKGVAAMMSSIQQPSLAQEAQGGQQVYRIRGKLAADALAPLLGTTVQGSTVDVELAIDTQRLYLLEAVVAGRVTPAEADGVVRVITLSRFNEPITIEPPT